MKPFLPHTRWLLPALLVACGDPTPPVTVRLANDPYEFHELPAVTALRQALYWRMQASRDYQFVKDDREAAVLLQVVHSGPGARVTVALDYNDGVPFARTYMVEPDSARVEVQSAHILAWIDAEILGRPSKPRTTP